MDRIWWEQITKASLLCRKVIDALTDGDSVILRLSQHVPWYETFADIICEGIVNNGIPRSISYADGTQCAGKNLLETYCKKEIRMKYRVGKSYAAFLAEQDAITLNSTIVWVKNVDARTLSSWMSFIREYNRNLPEFRQGALFLLEIHGDEPAMSGKHIRCIDFSSEISAYDKYTFCALASSSAPTDSRLKPYLAELVSTVCADDVELCARCISDGVEFANDPISYIHRISEESTRSDGTPFEAEIEPEELRHRVWESQIRTLFPLIERFRMQFVKDHHEEIRQEFPKETAFGEIIAEPEAAEIGLLYYLAGSYAGRTRDSAEWARLKDFKEARNELAHLNPLPFETVYKLLTGNAKQ